MSWKWATVTDACLSLGFSYYQSARTYRHTNIGMLTKWALMHQSFLVSMWLSLTTRLDTTLYTYRYTLTSALIFNFYPQTTITKSSNQPFLPEAPPADFYLWHLACLIPFFPSLCYSLLNLKGLNKPLPTSYYL